MPAPFDLSQLDLKSLRVPHPNHLAFTALGFVLGAVLPFWLGLQLAVSPDAALRIELDGRSVAGQPVAPDSVPALRASFDRYDFDLDAVAQGERDVPALYVTKLPRDWGQRTDAAARKRTFVKLMLPLILRENGRILNDRARLIALREESGGELDALSDRDRAWLGQLAERYRTEPGDWATLLRRVDAVPASLALAQGAKESGWGASRFAKQGNALFGQWTWTPEDGIAPKEPQKGKGDYAVRAFDRIGGSVAAYLENLNTHAAYQHLRDLRAQQRAAGKPLDGLTLAGGLDRYSQRGEVYVEEVRAMIRHNGFQRYDRARLTSAGPTG